MCIYCFSVMTKCNRQLDQVSHVHRHLINTSVVEFLNVIQSALVINCDKVDGHTFTTKTATTTNSVNEQLISNYKTVQRCIYFLK